MVRLVHPEQGGSREVLLSGHVSASTGLGLVREWSSHVRWHGGGGGGSASSPGAHRARSADYGELS